MENATKAMLIAAAVLIAIVIIAGGVLLLNSGANTKNQADKVGEQIGNASQGIAGNIQTGLGSIANKKCSSCEGTGVIKKLVCNKCGLDDFYISGTGHNRECEHSKRNHDCPGLKESTLGKLSKQQIENCECTSSNPLLPMCRIICPNCPQQAIKVKVEETDCPDC